MPQSLEAGLPPVTLTDGYVITFEARDPTTGAAVAGVKVSNTVLFADITGSIALEQLGPFMFVPGPGGTAV